MTQTQANGHITTATATGPELGLITAIYRTTNALVRELDRRLGRDHGITFIQAVTLLAIQAYDRPQPHLVAEHLSQQSQTVTGVLDRLERAGLISRVRDLNDRRGVRLDLTGAGRDLVAAIGDSLDSHLLELLRRVPHNTQLQLQDDLGAIEESVREVQST